jgi:phytoene synthase
VTAEDLAAAQYTPRFLELARWEARRARDYYRRAWAALPARDRRRLFAAEIMGRTYLALLDAMEAREFRVLDGRVALPAWRRMTIALSCWLGARVRRRPRL